MSMKLLTNFLHKVLLEREASPHRFRKLEHLEGKIGPPKFLWALPDDVIPGATADRAAWCELYNKGSSNKDCRCA